MRAAALLPLILAAGLAGCATPTPYAAADRPGGAGWSEQQVQGDAWRVAFTGAGGATPRRVFELALLRAAELTLAQGGRWLTLTGEAGASTDPRWGRIGAWTGEDPGYATTLNFTIGRGDARPTVAALDAREVAENLRAQRTAGLI